MQDDDSIIYQDSFEGSTKFLAARRSNQIGHKEEINCIKCDKDDNPSA